MALIQLDPNSLSVEVRVGIEETYKPNKKIKDFYAGVKQLKDETFAFLKENFGTLDVKEINSIIEKDAKKKAIWEDYLKETYAPEYLKLRESLEKINEKLCPNYKDLKSASA